jgi:hypothetical protein
MALPALRPSPFVVLGALWGACQFVAGVILDRAKRRALAAHEPPPRIV